MPAAEVTCPDYKLHDLTIYTHIELLELNTECLSPAGSVCLAQSRPRPRSVGVPYFQMLAVGQ